MFTKLKVCTWRLDFIMTEQGLTKNIPLVWMLLLLFHFIIYSFCVFFYLCQVVQFSVCVLNKCRGICTR